MPIRPNAQAVVRHGDGLLERVFWQSLARFAAGEVPLYPAGLLRLLGVG